jgi:hypothetical protein
MARGSERYISREEFIVCGIRMGAWSRGNHHDNQEKVGKYVIKSKIQMEPKK